MDPASIDIGVEDNVLTLKAERTPTAGDGVEVQFAERLSGVLSRQLYLGQGLDTQHTRASYDTGVLTLRIPMASQAKSRKIEVLAGNGAKQLTA